MLVPPAELPKFGVTPCDKQRRRLESQGKFPRRIQLTARSRAYSEAELLAHIDERTATGPNQAIQVRLQDSLLSAIEGFRRNEPDIPTRPEAVRRLLHQALELNKGRLGNRHSSK
jgi:hypothetical protein